MNIETPNDEIAAGCLANGDVVELEECFYMLGCGRPGENVPLMYLGRRPTAKRTSECLTETRFVPRGLLVRFHPHAKLVIP